MASALALAMPILVINMGGEMVYILEQRLDAQGVSSDKALRVLADVTRTMYHESFVSELFKPQGIYSVQSVRQIFDRLAHSSIMRLNEASMDKLFDLMLMGFKYQLLSCSYPAEVLQVTLTHLRALISKVNDPSVVDTVTAVSKRVMQTYGAMGAGEWGQIRRSLCGFFQDRKVKVSLFLQDGLQNDDGTLVNDVRGKLPPGVAVPGRIQTYGPGGGGSASAPSASSVFLHPKAAEVVLLGPAEMRTTTLGQNIYARERSSAAAGAPTIPSSELDDGGQWPAPAQPPHLLRDSSHAASDILAGKQVAQATKELNLLASLITAPAAPAAPFKINLFPDSFGGGGGGEVGAGGRVETITIDFSKSKGRQELDALVSGMDLSTGAQNDDDDDDLLALMDQASSK